MSIRIIVKRMCRILPDRLYLNIKFFMNFGKLINFSDPKTYNEKLQWLQL